MVGGEAGQGVQSVGFLLAKTLARGGYHVFADQDYESRIRGGHNFFRVRAKDSEVGAILEPVDMVLALNEESLLLHDKELTREGVVLYDSGKIKEAGSKNAVGLPLEKLAEDKAGNKLMANTVALGAALGMAGYDLDILTSVLEEHFGSAAGKSNASAARAGYDYVNKNFAGRFARRLSPIGSQKRMLLNGNEAIALGAIAAGCRFMAAYPMTPATSIMEYLAEKAGKYDLIVIQPEDEIAAINMAIGASYAGLRAMTATSGSGFCLMVEGLGLAGITETPIVVVDGQRPGPAVGLPTRTEQGDLQFVLHAHHGEFPRAVLAPAGVEEAFWLTVKAFNLAEKYQLPVIVLTDQHLATSYATVNRFDLSKVTVDRGLLYSARPGSPQEYKRHQLTESGISPRAFPGQEGVLVVTDADEHDETGHLTEDARSRSQQVQKRLAKLEGLRQEIAPPKPHGPKKAETTLIGWGSTYGAIREAVDILNAEGASVNSLHLDEIWPFPAAEVVSALDSARNSYVIENNATGQLSRLIRAETGREASDRVLKFDGRPFTPAGIVQEVNRRRL